jgi:GAF domain-containing protein
MGNSPEAGSGQSPALAGEQAALRRVATLVARAASQADVFAAVAEEVGRVLHADRTFLTRYNDDGTATLVAAWSAAGEAAPISYHGPLPEGGPAARVQATGHPVHTHRYPDDSLLASLGVRSGVIAPITVGGRLWGFMTVGSVTGPPPAPGTEARLAGFTELVAAAIANADAREELRRVADEQAALRRVATLIARGAPPAEVFAAVAAEVTRVIDVDVSFLSRYASDGTATVVAVSALPSAVPVGTQFAQGGRNIHTLVFKTGQPARIEGYAEASGPAASVARETGVHSAVGVPITVEGQHWGVMAVANTHDKLLPTDTEARLAGFTELAATAIANAQARTELRGFAGEQAALRRVATLVARGAAPQDVFTAVTAEAGRAVSADFTSLWRYDPDGAVTAVGSWGAGRPYPMPVGTWLPVGGANVHTDVFRTHRPARLDRIEKDPGAGLAPSIAAGVRSGVGVPVWVEGKLWGAMVASSTGEPLPADTEARLAGFTELVATAIANAEAQVALRASRARIVAAADATRRQIERELHAGAQQRLVSLALQLRAAQADVPPGAAGLVAELDQVAGGLTGVLEELREFARGIHPAILADGGLGPALRTLARRCPIPVTLEVQAGGRLPEPAEVCAYYVASEALANAAKHSRAATVTVQVLAGGDALTVQVRDDGVGGARLGAGTGLIGLKDRVEALGGRFTLHSTLGEGTTVTAQLPLTTQSP